MDPTSNPSSPAPSPLGLRERKKLETRHRLGDVAARLFAERGYDAVSISEVARAAGLAEQTVYNYFPTKPELVLDRADEFLARTQRVVAERDAEITPADAIRALVHDDIERLRDFDSTISRGEFPALCLTSEVLRRYALSFRNDQAEAIAHALAETDPEIPPLIVRAHAAALVAVIQTITDRIGTAVLSGADPLTAMAGMRRDADAALDDAAASFRATKGRAVTRPGPPASRP